MIRISKVTMTMRELDRLKCIQGLIDGQLKQHVPHEVAVDSQCRKTRHFHDELLETEAQHYERRGEFRAKFPSSVVLRLGAALRRQCGADNRLVRIHVPVAVGVVILMAGASVQLVEGTSTRLLPRRRRRLLRGRGFRFHCHSYETSGYFPQLPSQAGTASMPSPETRNTFPLA